MIICPNIKWILKRGLKNTISNYKDNESKTKIHYGNMIKINYRNFKDIDLEITRNNILLPSFCLAENPILENIASMIEFDIMQSSLLANLIVVTIDKKFLISVIN